jgi:hypothetical protein
LTRASGFVVASLAPVSLGEAGGSEATPAHPNRGG